MTKSYMSKFYKLSITDRIIELEKLGWLSPKDAKKLKLGHHVITNEVADKMIENTLGIFGLPLSVAPNFIINNRECIVPLVVEEPSVVAGLSQSALMARATNGFKANLSESFLTGQIHIINIKNVESAIINLKKECSNLIEKANEIHPRLNARGGGVRNIEFKILNLQDKTSVISVHILVDTCDAMGANLVNTICESMAPTLEKISGGKAILKILSNYLDHSVCSSTVIYNTDSLGNSFISGEEVRDLIILANQIATFDVHRAVTSNKGIMNGIDAVAIATGNDWRAIEASIHAYAARNGQYSTLTKWSSSSNGNLKGEIKIPIKPGIVGGSLLLNPAASLGLELCGVETAKQLAEMMASVGIAQNFAALRALVTDGIQKGHMRLHARSVASLVKTPNHFFDDVVKRLVKSNEIKDWKATEILNDLENERALSLVDNEFSAGKIILLGEHAAVYGKHALAVPILNAVGANVSLSKEKTKININEWNLNESIEREDYTGISGIINTIYDSFEIKDLNFKINISSSLPRGMGLGSSAAISVAIIRAVSKFIKANISNEEINNIAFSCEKLAHGSPSGIDNTLSCFGKPILFQKNKSPNFEIIKLNELPPLLIGFSRHSSHTIQQVSDVNSRYNKNISQYEAIFDQIDDISCKGAKAIKKSNYDELGLLMNICHGLLNAIEISTPDLENMINIARANGAIGAKLTGSGGGGSIVALCPDSIDSVQQSLHQSGYETLRPYVSRGLNN